MVQQLPNQNLDFAPRLLLGKYAIGESRGFLLHSGLMGQVSFCINPCCYLTAQSYLPSCPNYQNLVSTEQKSSQNNRLVRVIECPPLRLETPQEWGQVSLTILVNWRAVKRRRERQTKPSYRHRMFLKSKLERKEIHIRVVIISPPKKY